MDLALFWMDLRRRLRKGRIEALWRMDRILINAVREARLAAEFLAALMTGRTDLPGESPG
jgi:hypothetical protein